VGSSHQFGVRIAVEELHDVDFRRSCLHRCGDDERHEKADADLLATGSGSPEPRRSNRITREKEPRPSRKRRAAPNSHMISTWHASRETKSRSRGPSPNTLYAIETSPLRAYRVSG